MGGRDAFKAVVDNQQSVSGAAKKFSVPKQTLEKRVKHGSHPGPKLPYRMRRKMHYFEYMAKHEFPLTPKMVMAFAWAIAIQSGRQHCFSDSGPTRH